MRIISGIRRGHKLFEFEGQAIRPTTDRVKESIFNLIQFHVPGAKVLDLFAGSGALSFEAISRGAAEAVLIDRDPDSVSVIEQNRRSLGFEASSSVLCMDGLTYLKTAKESFGIIFLDPPYNKGFIEPVLREIASGTILAPDGIAVLESDFTDEPGEVNGLVPVKRRKYGRTVITLFGHEQSFTKERRE